MRLAVPPRSVHIPPRRLIIQIVFFASVFLLWITSATTFPLLSSAQGINAPTRLRSSAGTPAAISAAQVTSEYRSSAPSVGSLSIPGQPQVDANTVALYHFDYPTGNQVIDATGRYTGTLQGNAAIATTGLYGGVLTLDGQGSYVRIGNLGPLSQGTIEAFVDFTNVCDPGIMYSGLISAGSEFGQNNTVMQLGASTLFDIFANGQWNQVDSGVNPCRYLNGSDQWQNFYNWNLQVKWPYETWRFHHVAATWGPRGMEVWIDGVLYGVGVTTAPTPPHYVYYCNPQLYVSSPFYPLRCLTPVPAPQMTPYYPPGDYTGPLPPYNTFLIGCNASGGCFRGRIDEVRISDIQRTFQYTIVPTITPIPTQTPVPIVGTYAVDPNTVALYHLDTWTPCIYSSCVMDEVTGQPHPALGAIIPNGHFNSALASSPSGPSVEAINLTQYLQGTAEAWVRFDAGTVPQPIFSTGSGALALASLWNGPLYFSISDGTNQHEVISSQKPENLLGCWHHVAGTWGSRGVEFWIDGILQGVDSSYVGGMYYSTGWHMGSDFSGHSMSGALDEIRVSDVQRTFSPRMLARANYNSPGIQTGLGTPSYLPWIAAVPAPVCPFGN